MVWSSHRLSFCASWSCPPHARLASLLAISMSCSSLVANLVCLASVSKTSLFASASFRSSVGSPIVDAYAKAAVGGVRCCPDLAPSDSQVN
ncbi:hypothetical protein BHE74_00014692 [Ensete ventricosum]|nr:hypothetical protein BHE74_00014692 [Ensete ventricosum]RZS01295.1 hypothetical protein BHM03_00031164 [Ensete ventricosum]